MKGRPRGRYRQLIRCLRLVASHIDGALSPERVKQLAKAHGVSTRTIHRDLAALREAGHGEATYVEADIPPDRVRP